MKHVDVLVVGGGVASCIFALTCPSELDVLIIDRKKCDTSTNGFEKPCGGLLSADAQKSLAKLGLTLPLSVLVNPQIFAVKTMDANSKLTRIYQRFYINIHRHRFDCWLATLIKDKVTFVNDALAVNIQHSDNHSIVTYRKDNQTFSVSCTTLVGADGAASIVRKSVTKKPIRHYLAIQEHMKAKDVQAQLSCFFDCSITNSYGWASVKDDSLIYGVALPLDHTQSRFSKFKEMIQDFGIPNNEVFKKEACLVNSPSSPFQIVEGKNNVVLIGEAAGFISPSSLEGISYAMDSAMCASKSFNNKIFVLKKYKQLTFKLKGKIALKIFKSIVLYTPWIRKLVLLSNIHTIKVETFK